MIKIYGTEYTPREAAYDIAIRNIYFASRGLECFVDTKMTIREYNRLLEQIAKIHNDLLERSPLLGEEIVVE